MAWRVTTGGTRAERLSGRKTPVIPRLRPIVVPDAIVRSLARPGGNLTGFGGAEFGFSIKWLELLKEIAPRVTRVAVIRDPGGAGGNGFLGALQGVAPSFRVELNAIDASDAAEIESAVTAFAHGADGGMIVPPSTS